MEPNGTPLRPVSRSVNDVLGELPTGAFNYGLFFNKWFYVDPKQWKCHTALPAFKGKIEPSLLNNMDISIKLFNGDKPSVNGKTGFWDSSVAKTELEKKSRQLNALSAMYEKMGYLPYRKEVALSSALVIGLGNEHPTEKGFRFDWMLGVPMIPSSSIKGVVRLAYLVNELRNFENEKDAEEFCKKISRGCLSSNAKDVFGSDEQKSNGQTASRGNVIFLDAFPAVLPRLKPEIMTCHYKDYLMDGGRGPTEDQQPNPQQFWAVSPFVDANEEKPLKFVFRMLIHKSIHGDKARLSILEAALNSALSEHGVGAKTAIGHGRFDTNTKGNSNNTAFMEPSNENSAKNIDAPVSAIVETAEHWPTASLTWKPNNSTLEASFNNKKAIATGKNLVPESFHKKLFVQRRAVIASVMVTATGNKYVIAEVGMPGQPA